MAASLSQVPPFQSGSNPSEAWRLWRQDFLDYLTALRYSHEDEGTKLALFRHVCGEELKKQYHLLKFAPVAPATQVTLTQVFNEFDKHYGGYQSEIFASYIFLEINQKPDERFETFYSSLRMAIVDCCYGVTEDRMLRDKIVQGLHDKALQERLLRESRHKNLTLKEVVDTCKAAELSKAQVQIMNRDKTEVHGLAQGKKKQNKKNKFNAANNQASGTARPNVTGHTCGNCGRVHEKYKCPAYGTTCTKCMKKNHWASKCRSKTQQTQQQQRAASKSVNFIEQSENHSNDQNNSLYLGALTQGTPLHIINPTLDSNAWLQDVWVDNTKVTFKLDTGAQVNVLPNNVFLGWNSKPILRPVQTPVLDYSNNEVPIIGECTVHCATNKASSDLTFVVTTLDAVPVLGLQSCTALGLVNRMHQLQRPLHNNKIFTSCATQQVKCTGGDSQMPKESATLSENPTDILKEFHDVFEGTGRIKRTVSIRLKEGAVPHVAGPRKIPLALHDRVKSELDQMVKDGIITKVTEPTEWVSNLVVVEKPGKLRICIDPRPLNVSIQRPHYPIPSVEQLFQKLQGCTYYTVLDARNAFWHLPLDEKSSYLTTFTSPWGRYRFLVMPYGLSCAPEEFQRAMEDIFLKEPKLGPYFDDTAFGTNTLPEHCVLLRRILTIAREENVKFNIKKLQLAQHSIRFLGHIISEKGIEPDPSKVIAITTYVAPTNVEELRRFLGMVTYQAKFTPHLSTLTHSLRLLLKRDTAWVWDENTEQDFQRIKSTLATAPCLRIFDSSKSVTVSVDASQYGLGAVLLQEGEPVAYASASLTTTQQKYAQIEKELLAVLFGLEHFNYYTYGRAVEVQTDHKPLLGLSTKPFDLISPRLQRLLLKLQRYNVTLTYIPGKELVTADALSRSPLPSATFEEEQEPVFPARMCLLAEASTAKWEELSGLTAADPALQDVLYHVRNGWSADYKSTRPAARSYWHCRQELHETQDGILCRGRRLIVPAAAQRDVLSKLHTGHRGIVATKAKAREYFYWPSLNTDVEQYITNCVLCQQHQRANQREPLVDREIPQRPWQKVAIDFFELGQKHYLLVVDYFSKYIEVQHLHGTSASAVIACLKAVFARHGIPEEVVSDQGPPFQSEELKKFFVDWTISHNPSSPHYPRSNGQVERSIQTFKNSLRKAEKEGKDLHLVLLDYRITPAQDLPSPAELLMGRKLRSLLPAHPDLLLPNFETQQVRNTLLKRQERQKKSANQHTKLLKPLKENDRVWFRLKPKCPWQEGTVQTVCPQPHTYLVRAASGKLYTRNRFYIRLDPRKSDSCALPSLPGAEMSVTNSVEDFYPCLTSSVLPLPGNSAQTQVRSSGRQVRRPAYLKDYI